MLCGTHLKHTMPESVTQEESKLTMFNYTPIFLTHDQKEILISF